jgi:hypothetical protein
MQFKSFMEALKGKQHKIDKNKNGEIDSHDFKLLRKEGEELEEAKMSDAEVAEKERIVKGMKKNLTGFKARYGDRAKEVMYATATKQAMKEETVDEAVQKVDVPAYLRKQKGEAPLKMSDLKRKDTISDKENLAKLRNEETEQIDERMVADEEGIAKKLVAKHGRNVNAHDIKLAIHLHPEGYKTTHERIASHVNRLLGKPVREETEQLDEAMINGREYASHGLMHPDHAARDIHKVTGQSIDFYAHGTGDKVEGKVTKNDGKAVHIKDTKGNTHKFKVQRGLPKQQNEAKDVSEYDYEGEMAVTQLKTIMRHAEALQAKMQPDTNLPEWVQSKITLAADYIQTASDYLHSELEEQAPVAPVPDRKYIKGTPEHKAYKATKKPINNMPTNVKESFDADGNIINNKVSYKEFAMMLEYETKDGRYVHKGTYGGSYVDPEGADDADDKKPKQQPAVKRGRGRPAGAKSGAGKITGTSKLYK